MLFSSCTDLMLLYELRRYNLLLICGIVFLFSLIIILLQMFKECPFLLNLRNQIDYKILPMLPAIFFVGFFPSCAFKCFFVYFVLQFLFGHLLLLFLFSIFCFL